MNKIIILLLFILLSASHINAQNKNFFVGLSLGAGYSGFKTNNTGEDKLSYLFYPMGGILIQKRIKPKWAISIFPNLGMSGNIREFSTAIAGINKIKSTSAFINLAVHPKYYINKKVYVSAGPEIAYLIWNQGSAFIDDERISRMNETEYFNRVNLLVSSSIGFSLKVEESRKNAPIQIDALWYLEFRTKKGITNILNKDYFGNEYKSSILSFEIVTGISFSSKR